MENSKINFLDLLIIVVKGKRFIVVFTVVMSIIAVIYSLVTYEKWTSRFSIIPILDTSATVPTPSLFDGFGFGSGLNLKSVSLKNSVILKSRTFSESVVRQFNLIDYFKITEPDTLKAMDFAIRNLHTQMLDVILNDEVYFLTVNVTSKDRQLSQNIAQYYLDYITSYNLDNSNNIGRQRKELLEQRVDVITNEMNILAEELRLFQNEHNIVEMQGQSLAIIDSYGSLLEEFLSVEVELIHVTNIMPNSIRHRDLADKRRILLDTIGRLETGYDATPFLLSLNNLTDKAFTVREKSFRLELYQRMLLVLHPQLENARIEEINSIDRLEVIDMPNFPGERTHPKRAIICIITFMLSFLFSTGCVIMYNILSDEDKGKLRMLWTLLFRWKS